MKSSNLALRMEAPLLPPEPVPVSKLALAVLSSGDSAHEAPRAPRRSRVVRGGIVIRDQGLRFFRVG